VQCRKRENVAAQKGTKASSEVDWGFQDFVTAYTYMEITQELPESQKTRDFFHYHQNHNQQNLNPLNLEWMIGDRS
jgi:hypothetical protein